MLPFPAGFPGRAFQPAGQPGIHRGRLNRISSLAPAGAAPIGIGSLVFHGHPAPLTLTADLVPIQLFGLAVMSYILLRYLKRSPVATVALLLLGLGVALKRRELALSRYLFGSRNE